MMARKPLWVSWQKTTCSCPDWPAGLTAWPMAAAPPLVVLLLSADLAKTLVTIVTTSPVLVGDLGKRHMGQPVGSAASPGTETIARRRPGRPAAAWPGRPAWW